MSGATLQHELAIWSSHLVLIQNQSFDTHVEHTPLNGPWREALGHRNLYRFFVVWRVMHDGRVVNGSPPGYRHVGIST